MGQFKQVIEDDKIPETDLDVGIPVEPIHVMTSGILELAP
jgi:hypothetical protein